MSGLGTNLKSTKPRPGHYKTKTETPSQRPRPRPVSRPPSLLSTIITVVVWFIDNCNRTRKKSKSSMKREQTRDKVIVIDKNL